MGTIRVGIIGLSAAQDYGGPGTWAAATHLPALQNLDNYKIVALANSTVESAKRSIAAHNLPPSAKAYGSPEDIASDPDVDLVVVCVQVQKHYELAKPALLNKKKVLVEWPIAATINDVEELTQLAKDNAVDTAVGLQARAAPAIQKLKEILSSGQIGRVLSSTVVGSSSKLSTETWAEDLKYYLDISSGVEFAIGFGHCTTLIFLLHWHVSLTTAVLDTFIEVLGDIPHPQAILKTHFQTTSLLGSDGKVVNPAYRKTDPDHILVQGITEDGTVSSFAIRTTKDPVDGTGIRWIICGTKGEISITSPEWWQMRDKEAQIQVKLGSEPAQIIDFDSYRVPASEKVAHMASNVASLYDAFAEGDTGKYATFESAAKTHRLLDRIKKYAVIE
jgi:predicted dehydrogenase